MQINSLPFFILKKLINYKLCLLFRSSVPYPPRKNDLPPDSRQKLSFRKSGRESHPSTLRSESKDHYGTPNFHYVEDLPPPRGIYSY